MTTFIVAVAAALPGMMFADTGRKPGEYEAKYPYCNTRSCDQRAKERSKRNRIHKRYPHCNTWRCVRKSDRRAVRRAHARTWNVVRPFNGKLNRIASCESGGRWHIATGNGFFGGLQFTLGTWASVGGQGMPHLNTPLEQKYRAVLVFKRRGSWADWPVCGFR
jgi:hypothetical protein